MLRSIRFHQQPTVGPHANTQVRAIAKPILERKFTASLRYPVPISQSRGHKVKKTAVVFVAWGEKYVKEVEMCVQLSKDIWDHDIFLVTDENTRVNNDLIKVIRASFKTEGLLRKTELIGFLPEDHELFLFLDSDTRVIEDIGLGFAKADKFGIALSPAPNYSLDHFAGFDKILRKEGADCKGQLQYNTGVIFFKKSARVWSVFRRWRKLASKYKNEFKNDQPFFTLALDQLDFNPYTLSISYNYRAMGDAISGLVRIWHSHEMMPEAINVLEQAWPARRAIGGRMLPPFPQ